MEEDDLESTVESIKSAMYAFEKRSITARKYRIEIHLMRSHA